MAMEKEDKIFGKLLINFANSETSEKAILSLGKKVAKLLPRKKDVIKIVADDFYEAKKQDLRKLLDEIIAIDNLRESKLISNYIRTYNEHCTAKMILNDSGKIRNRRFFYSLGSIQYDELLAYSIVRFLKKFEVNKQYIHRCKFEDCKRYFLSIQRGPRPKTCPDPKCRNRNTYTEEEYKQYHEERKKNKARSKVKDIIIDLINQGEELKDLKESLNNDTKLSKYLEKSKWSIETAYEAAMMALKKLETENNDSTE